MASTRRAKRNRRKLHIRKNVTGSAQIPRVCVYRSNRYLYAHVVNDDTNLTVLGISEKNVKPVKDEKPAERALRMGKDFGKKVVDKGITKIVFDRGGYKFHGRVKAFADGMRDAGVQF